MAPAPQPPHERAWRHPSELAPTALDVVAPSEGGGRSFLLATGVAAVMLTAAMVVALTPPRSNAPTAVSATTMPAATVQLRSSAAQIDDADPTARDAEPVQLNRNTVTRNNALALVGSPNAISAAPTADPESSDVAEQLPGDSDPVYLLTNSHTYAMDWAQLDRIIAPDGSVVVTPDGGLLALFVNGELLLLVD
ncbi:MAG: hypothetical protein AB8G14_11405 [Ilumatobacter sp.]